jgi:uncharacterized protein (TIGR00369 family)
LEKAMTDYSKLTGLEALKKLVAGDVPPPAIAKTLDFTLLEVSEGHAVFEGHPSAAHYNPLGTVHGGYAATLLDSALGCAVHAALPAGQTYTTLEIKVSYVRAMTATTGPVRAEATVIHVGKRVATAEARLTDASGKLYAHGTTTCIVMPL